MHRTMCKSTIHRVTVTRAGLRHGGSPAVDADRTGAAGLLPGERARIAGTGDGARPETRGTEVKRRSGVIGSNGAAARPVRSGDLVATLSRTQVSASGAGPLEPRVVHGGGRNRLTAPGRDLGVPVPGSSRPVRGD